jgi:three-Cys-motif partner protein
MKMKKSDQDKLQDQLRVVGDADGRNIIGNLNSLNLGFSGVDNEYGPHTLLKLSYLNYYLGVFLTIANRWKKKGRFNKIVFVDAFAGSGLVGIKDSGSTVLGSTLLAAGDKRVDQVISIEKDGSKANILEKRCVALGYNNVAIEIGDTNQLIPLLPSRFNIGPKSIVMLFLDPEGMEPEFSQFVPLSKATDSVDIILNYTWGVYRLAGRIEKGIYPGDLERMKKLIPNYIAGDNPDEKLLEYFEKQFGKPIGRKIDIHSDGSKIVYSMILRVRQTTSGSPWVSAMDEFGNFVSSIDGDRALKALNVVKGVQTTL